MLDRRLLSKATVQQVAYNRQKCCLIDFCIGLPFARSPMVVFEVIGQLGWRCIRAFMIATEREWEDVSESQTRFDPLLF